MLQTDKTQCLIVDVQEKLLPLVHRKDDCFSKLRILIQGCMVMNIPLTFTEQVPEKLGETVATIRSFLNDFQAIPKKSFSCLAQEACLKGLKDHKRPCVLLAGIETHVCVYQTAVDLINEGFEVHLVCDATSSRDLEDHKIGIHKIEKSGGILTSTETAMFELLKEAEGEIFRAIIKMVK